MLTIARRTLVGAVLLLIMPVIVWISGWQWQPGIASGWLKPLFIMTETVTRPWGILTTIVLCGWFIWYLQPQVKPALFLLAIMIITVVGGQSAKSLIKGSVQEPRPYVLWMEKNYGINDSDFYHRSRQARSEQVKQLVASDSRLPDWLKQHWAFETGFSFPSGHTLFVGCWALLAVGLLWPRRHFTSVVVIFIWADLVMGSRLLLGMHWPRDLVASICMSWILVTLAIWLVQRVYGSFLETEEQA